MVYGNYRMVDVMCGNYPVFDFQDIMSYVFFSSDHTVRQKEKAEEKHEDIIKVCQKDFYLKRCLISYKLLSLMGRFYIIISTRFRGLFL